MCLYTYIHYGCGCTHREEDKCEFSTTPFMEIFCPNIDLQRINHTYPCGQEDCFLSARNQVQIRQHQLKVLRIHGVMVQAKAEYGSLQKRQAAIMQTATARNISPQAHPHWSSLVASMGELQRQMIECQNEGQLSLAELAQLKGLPPTEENIHSLVREMPRVRDGARVAMQGQPQMHFVAPTVPQQPQQAIHPHPPAPMAAAAVLRTTQTSVFPLGARRLQELNEAYKASLQNPSQQQQASCPPLTPGQQQRFEPFFQQIKRQQEELIAQRRRDGMQQAQTTTVPRRGPPPGPGPSNLSKMDSTRVKSRGGDAEEKRRSDRNSGKLVNYNEDDEEEVEEQEAGTGESPFDTPGPPTDEEDGDVTVDTSV